MVAKNQRKRQKRKRSSLDKAMIAFVRIGVIISCVFFFVGLGSAQQNDLQYISSSESSKMFKNPNGLFSSSEMQADQKYRPAKLDSNKADQALKKKKGIKNKNSMEQNKE